VVSESIHEFLVPSSEAGQRLDRYLAKQALPLSRSQIQQLLEAGHITLNGKQAKPAHHLKGGEGIRIEIPPTEPSVVLAQALPLDILFEDKDLLVLNKAAEMVVHLGAGVKEGTLVNALLHHCRDLSGIGGVARPGIVHRLDKGTSGLMVVAKNDLAHHSLADQFQSRQIEKTYLAFVWGTPRDRSGKIDLPLGRSARDRKKIDIRGTRLREAVTRFRLVKSWGEVSLLELKPETGRTHQLRVHLAELGHPIVGDPTYGKTKVKLSKLDPKVREFASTLDYQLLHAWRLSFHHPASRKAMAFEAPMREEMRRFEEVLEKVIHDPL